MPELNQDKHHYVRYVPDEEAAGGSLAVPHERPSHWLESGHYLIVVDQIDDQVVCWLVMGGVWPIPVPLPDGTYMRIYWLHLETGNYVGLSKADADWYQDNRPMEAHPLDRCIKCLGEGQFKNDPARLARRNEMFPVARMIYRMDWVATFNARLNPPSNDTHTIQQSLF